MKAWISCANFDDDVIVNFEDFCALALQWQQIDDTITADLNYDRIIDERDLAAL
jgi:hypothetical protein